MNPYLAAVIGAAGITGIALGVVPPIRAWLRQRRIQRRAR